MYKQLLFALNCLFMMHTEMAARACLRQATREHQEQLQALPFFRSLAAGTMDAASYLDFLKVMEAVHEAVDEAARRLLLHSAVALWDERSSRRAAFAADIACLEAKGTRQRSVNAQVYALALGEEVMALVEAGDTMALLGALYVLHGLTLGAPVLRAQLERLLHTPLAAEQTMTDLEAWAAKLRDAALGPKE